MNAHWTLLVLVVIALTQALRSNFTFITMIDKQIKFIKNEKYSGETLSF